MHSLTLHLVACLSAALTTFAQTTGVDVFVTTATVFPPPEANGTTLNGTFVYTCPVAPTVFVNFTEYIPVIETTTQPLTVYQTIISTTVLTSVRERICFLLLLQLLIRFVSNVGSARHRNHHRDHHHHSHHRQRNDSNRDGHSHHSHNRHPHSHRTSIARHYHSTCHKRHLVSDENHQPSIHCPELLPNRLDVSTWSQTPRSKLTKSLQMGLPSWLAMPAGSR